MKWTMSGRTTDRELREAVAAALLSVYCVVMCLLLSALQGENRQLSCL